VGVAVSTATRTQQTWAIVEALYLAEPDAITEVSRCFASDVGIIVGHNPGLEELALSIPERGVAAADIAIKFPTSAFAVIEIDGEDWNWKPADARVSGFVICR
jgi:phosphohistidine phosphatase